MFADCETVQVYPPARSLWQRPFRHRAVFSAGQLPIRFSDAALIQIPLKQPRVLLYSFLDWTRSQFPMAARVKTYRNPAGIDACVQQCGVRPLLPSARKANVDNRTIRRAVLMKADVVVDSANRAPNARFGLDVFVEHVKYRAEFSRESLDWPEYLCLIFRTMLIEPLFVVVFDNSR